MKKIVTIFIVLIMMILPISSAQAQNVSDKTLLILKELEIMVGDENGNLNLEKSVTRAEFTKMAVKASKYKNSVALNLSISPFLDVTYKNWYAPYVKTASDNSLVKGYSDGSFKPENTVLYEEAVTVLLRLLGYTDDDFGSSWPYGQMGIAGNIGLLEGVNCSIGEYMTRDAVATLFGNFLSTKSKDSQNEYISNLGYTIEDDVILIATFIEDTSLGNGKISTSLGTYKINSYYDYSLTGKKGTVVIKNNDELVLFVPNNQIVENYTIYQVLDKNIAVIQNGVISSVNLSDELTVYNKSTKTNLKSVSSELAVGDSLTVYKNSNGVLDYGLVQTDELKGPYTIDTDNWISHFGYNNPEILKDGVKATTSDVNMNDIIYYSNKLNTVWVYSKKVTGIYEKAIPNKDNPTSVQISGEEYSIEGIDAFTKLSSKGDYKIGDTITVMLGKDGDIADVKDTNETSDDVYGYLVETGTKKFTDDDGSYSSQYAKIIMVDGTASTYKVKSDYSTIKNQIVKVNFTDDKYAKLSTVKASSVSFSTSLLADNVKILEISTTEPSVTGNYDTIYASRLEGINIKSSQIVFYTKNELGKIDEIFIKNVTGDLNDYGIVVSAPKKGAEQGSYTVNIAGEEINVSNSDIYSVYENQPCKIVYSGNTVDTISPLNKLSSTVNSVTETYITAGNGKYLLSDSACVYVRNTNYDYMLMSLNELIESQKDYSVTAYYDTLPSSGGRIRILTAVKK